MISIYEGAATARSAGAVASGLVPSKTSRLDTTERYRGTVDLSAPECALRRIARLKKSVWASGHLHGLVDLGSRPPVCWFVTLTYAFDDQWRPDHMSEAIGRFRSWCRARRLSCRYTWVAELTKRGRVHFHLLAWLPNGVRMPHWDRAVGKRAAFWQYGMTETEVARSGIGYLMKYLSKLGEFNRFPEGLRLYGIGGLNHQGRSVRAWYNLPEWVKRSYGVGDVCRSAWGYLVRASGEILAPAFKVSYLHGCLDVRQLRELPERFHDGAYSSVPRAVT